MAITLSNGLLASYLLGIDQPAQLGRVASFADSIRLSFDAAPEQAIEYFKNKRIVFQSEFNLLAEDARNAAFTVSGVYRRDVVEGFHSEIARALEEGIPQAQTIKRFREILAGAGHKQLGAFHLETVFRTNMQMAYGVGRRRGLESVAEDLPFWEYHSVGDDRVRPTHQVLNHIILPANHPFWASHFPPWDFNCRCTVTATDERPSGYNHNNPSGGGEIFYDDDGMPAKAKIGTSVYDLKAGDFRGVPPQGGLREVIEEGVKRSQVERPAKPTTPTTGALGTPISRAIQVSSKTTKAFRDSSSSVMKAIDSVHGDGQLPVIPLAADASKRYYGAYRSTYSGKAVDIRVSRLGDHKEFTLAHEVGHFIDQQGVTPGRFASESHPLFDEWRRAAMNSQAVQELKRARKSVSYGLQRRHLDYLLSDREVWARSYSQYIAMKSRDAVLLRQLESVRKIGAYPSQWEEADFKPIGEAIEQTLKSLKWMR